MLLHLHVKNFALIEEAHVDFGPGLNILTGETGAGKSILLGSMQLVLGGKISKNMIRDNTDYALAELLFQVENDTAAKKLAAMDIDLPDRQIVLSRKLMDKRSVCKINGSVCTVSQMKEAAACLIDIHGQHEHQSLLYKDKQREILDSYGGEEIRSILIKVRGLYADYQQLGKELKSMDMDEEQRSREKAFLEFEIHQIEEAALKEGEDELLEQEYRKLMNAQKISLAAAESARLLGYEGGAAEQTGRAIQELTRVMEYDDSLAEIYEQLGTIDSMLSDCCRSISGYMDDMSFDEAVFYETEKRLDLINSLKSKYGKTIPDILKYREVQLEKLEQLNDYEANIGRIKSKYQQAGQKLNDVCEELTKKRKKYAEQLEKEIIDGLRELNFLDVRFEIGFSKRDSYTEHGNDEIQYRIAANPGEKIKPLQEIVSGGELSRIMLAIKAILSDKDEIETLIFDEIDTGISGRTAQRVSEKMVDIGRNRQVLCITHLPQIAAMADTHFEISKTGDQYNKTQTSIRRLDPSQSVTELARMLGGAEITETVTENAREMKKLAEQYKHTC